MKKVNVFLAIIFCLAMLFMPTSTIASQPDRLNVAELQKKADKNFWKQYWDKVRKEQNSEEKQDTYPGANEGGSGDYIYLGTNYTTTILNIADYGSDTSYNATAKGITDLTNRKAKAQASASGIGWGKSWAYVGKRITVSNSSTVSSKNAYIKISGYRKGASVASGDAKYEIRLVVTDTTIGATLLDEIIETDMINGSQTIKNYNGTYPPSARTVLLMKGHTYDIMMKLVNEVNCNSNMSAQIAFNDNIYPNSGVGYASLDKVEVIFQ